MHTFLSQSCMDAATTISLLIHGFMTSLILRLWHAASRTPRSAWQAARREGLPTAERGACLQRRPLPVALRSDGVEHVVGLHGIVRWWHPRARTCRRQNSCVRRVCLPIAARG